MAEQTQLCNYDIFIQQGRDYVLAVTFKDSDGNAIDLTGYTWKAQLFNTHNNPEAVDFVFDTSDEANGNITMSLSNTVTAGISASDEFKQYEAIYKDTSNIVVEFLYGMATIEQKTVEF